MPIVDVLWSSWRRGRVIERIGYIVGAALLLSGLIHLTVQLVSGGSWLGPLSLRKPTTFGLSFGLTLINIMWASSFVRLTDRQRTILLAGFTIACALEVALVSLQAWRGVPSHFNVETPFDGMVARLLAGGGIALVLIIVALTTIACRANPTVPIHLRIAIRVGFFALCGSFAIGGLMIARGMLLVFGGHPEAAYSTAGSLKPTHAVMMHGILVLPLLAWLLSFTRWSEQRRLHATLVASAGYVVLATVVASSNLLGLEVQQVPNASLLVLALGAGALLTTGLLTALELAQMR